MIGTVQNNRWISLFFWDLVGYGLLWSPPIICALLPSFFFCWVVLEVIKKINHVIRRITSIEIICTASILLLLPQWCVMDVVLSKCICFAEKMTLRSRKGVFIVFIMSVGEGLFSEIRSCILMNEKKTLRILL